MSLTPPPPKQKINIFFVSAFTGILLLLLLLVLNYFTIISLSLLFPHQLGFLPHKEQNNTPVSQPTHSPTNYSPNTFQYDTEKAETILTKYIKDNIKPEFIPKNLDIKEGLSIDNRVEDNKRQFGSHFTANDATFAINFHYKENTNMPNDIFIFIQPIKQEKTALTQNLTNSLAASYFIKPYSPITNCDQKETTSYCENFRTENDGKRGYGALIGQDQSRTPPARISIVFTCFIPKESKDYDTTQSCISP